MTTGGASFPLSLRYSLFVKQSSAEIRAVTPSISSVDVMRACGSKWQSLSAQQKEEWNNRCKQ
jgi:hypothetical protein